MYQTRTKKRNRTPLYTINENANLRLKNYNPVLYPIKEEEKEDLSSSSSERKKSPDSEWWNNSKHSLQSSNYSGDFFIPIKLNNISKNLENINTYEIEKNKLIILRDNLRDDREKQQFLINDINKQIDFLINQIRLNKQIIIDYLNEIIIDAFSSEDLTNLINNIRLKNKSPEYKEKYKLYKKNLNDLLNNLDEIIKDIKQLLFFRKISNYKKVLINHINIVKKNIKKILSELIKYYNENLPIYKKKWWGGKTMKKI